MTLVCIASVAPTIAGSLERVFELERRLLGPHSHLLFASLLEQDAKRRRAGRRQFQRKDLEERVAIVNRPVSLVKETGTVQQVAEARAPEAVLSAFDPGRRTPPSFALKRLICGRIRHCGR